MFGPDFDKNVAFYSPYRFADSDNRAPDEKVLLPHTAGNGHVIRCLADLGVGSIFVDPDGLRDLDDPGRAWAVGRLARLRHEEAYYLYNDINLPLGDGGITAVRARDVTPRALANHVPVINGAEIRSIGESKARQYELFQEFMVRTVCIGPEDPIPVGVTNDFATSLVVYKGNSSQQSQQVMTLPRGTETGTIAYLRKGWQDDQGNAPTILLQEYQQGRPWPMVRPVDRDISDPLLLANECLNYELRMSAFATPGNYRLVPALKVIDGYSGRCTIAVRPDTVPKEAYEMATTVCRKLFEETSAPGFMAAIDMYWNENMQMQLREANLREPGLDFGPSIDTPPHLRLHAEQLAELAGANPSAPVEY